MLNIYLNSIRSNSIMNLSMRSFKFWNKFSKSSGFGKKSDFNQTLAYYCFDPSYLKEKKSNPIIIYHSLFTSKDMWHNIVQPLSQSTGRTVYLLDMRNHGESPHSKHESSGLRNIAKDVNDFMEEFKINKALLVGHGTGSRAMLQTAIDFGDKVEKVVAIDVSPMTLPLINIKATDIMFFTLASLPRDISLSSANLILKSQLSPYFRDKIHLYYILKNLKVNEKGFVKWKFNLPVIKQLIRSGNINKMVFDNQFSGDVKIFCGKYGLITAQEYSDLKNAFPNVKFNFVQRFGHFINIERPKKLIKFLVNFANSE